jgi:hypothetical protein
MSRSPSSNLKGQVGVVNDEIGQPVVAGPVRHRPNDIRERLMPIQKSALRRRLKAGFQSSLIRPFQDRAHATQSPTALCHLVRPVGTNADRTKRVAPLYKKMKE